ncbi:MAG: metallophosphoesterase [Deltaproteobacteria bacterium]
METLQDLLFPIGVLLLVIASQLYWLRRLIRLGEPYFPGKWGRAGLKTVVAGPCLFFFAYLLLPLTGIGRNREHPSTTLTLRNILVDAPFWWWFVGSLVGSTVALIFGILKRVCRAGARLYSKVRAIGAACSSASGTATVVHDPPSPPRRRFLEQTIAAVSAAPFVAAGYGLLYGRLDLEVTHQSIRLTRLPKALEGFRIVHLSDIHISPFMTGEQVRHYVEIANGLKPDLVALTGDYLSGDPRAQGEVVDSLAGLHAPCGVFGCLGNHEFFTDTEASITGLFAAKQIRILRQERASIQSRGETLNLIGVDYQEKRFSPDHDGHLVDQYLQGNEKLVMPGMVNILLDHNPSAFDRAAELGIDLTLSGHSHGGQVSLEFLRRGLSLAYTETPYVSGWYEKAGSQLYVNRGIGTTGPPIRFGERPEITVLELTRWE